MPSPWANGPSRSVRTANGNGPSVTALFTCWCTTTTTRRWEMGRTAIMYCRPSDRERQIPCDMLTFGEPERRLVYNRKTHHAFTASANTKMPPDTASQKVVAGKCGDGVKKFPPANAMKASDQNRVDRRFRELAA